jgi:hypothetical protein
MVICNKHAIYNTLLMLLLTSVSAIATAQILHRFGQSVQPVYEGFEQNSDGSYTLWFGYLNLNFDEAPEVELGTNNSFQVASGIIIAGPVDQNLVLDNAGPIDRGQPTHFYPRRQQFVFSVQVPSDFVDKELVWTLTYNGETRTAIGSIEKGNIWGVDEGVWSANRGRGTNGRTGVALANQPPAVRIVGVEGQLSATVGSSVALRTFASDDGLPGPREGAPRSEQPALPNFLPAVGGGIGRNSPKSQGIINYIAADETGLAVTWIKYRGPGQVQFDSAVTALPASGEETVASASFSQSGTYVLRAYADDGTYTRSSDVTVVVR